MNDVKDDIRRFIQATSQEENQYWLTRFVFLRLLGFVYLMAFFRLDDPSGAVWKRTYLREWLPPLSRSNPALKAYIAVNGWEN